MKFYKKGIRRKLDKIEYTDTVIEFYLRSGHEPFNPNVAWADDFRKDYRAFAQEARRKQSLEDGEVLNLALLIDPSSTSAGLAYSKNVIKDHLKEAFEDLAVSIVPVGNKYASYSQMIGDIYWFAINPLAEDSSDLEKEKALYTIANRIYVDVTGKSAHSLNLGKNEITYYTSAREFYVDELFKRGFHKRENWKRIHCRLFIEVYLGLEEAIREGNNFERVRHGLTITNDHNHEDLQKELETQCRLIHESQAMFGIGGDPWVYFDHMTRECEEGVFKGMTPFACMINKLKQGYLGYFESATGMVLGKYYLVLAEDNYMKNDPWFLDFQQNESIASKDLPCGGKVAIGPASGCLDIGSIIMHGKRNRDYFEAMRFAIEHVDDMGEVVSFLNNHAAKITIRKDNLVRMSVLGRTIDPTKYPGKPDCAYVAEKGVRYKSGRIKIIPVKPIKSNL